MPLYLPPPVTPTVTFTDVGSWNANTSYAQYTYYTLATTGDRYLVTNAYTSGGSFGTTDTNNTIRTSSNSATLAATYAPIGAAYKQAVAASGDTVSLAQPLFSNGLPVVANVTVVDLEIDMDYPPVGGTCVWRFSRFRPSDQSELVIGTVTVGNGNRSATAGGTGLTNTALLAGDRILVRNSASNGTTFPGQGTTAFVSFSGVLATMPAPSAATSLSVTGSTASSVTIGWTAGTHSTSSLVYRDGIPYAITGATTFTDQITSPHTYSVSAISPGGAGALVGPVSGSPTVGFSYYSQADGVPATTDWATTLGTNPGTAAAVASSVLTITSGNVGNGAQQDQVALVWNKDTSTHTAWRRTWKFGFATSNGIINWYFRVPGVSLTNGALNFTTSITQYIQCEFNTTGIRVGTKAPGVNSGNFVNQTITGSSNASTTTASGVIPFGFTLNPNGTLYGVSIECLPISGGTQVINIRTSSTAADVDSGAILTATPIVTVTLDATTVTAMQSGQSAGALGGFLYGQMLGQQSATSPISQIYKESTVTITPLTGSGL